MKFWKSAIPPPPQKKKKALKLLTWQPYVNEQFSFKRSTIKENFTNIQCLVFFSRRGRRGLFSAAAAAHKLAKRPFSISPLLSFFPRGFW